MKKSIICFVFLYCTFVFGMKPSINVLVLGGNGMLGSATVDALIRQDQPYNITILNRGNWYWDTENTVSPYVNHIKCNRRGGLRDGCTQLVEDDTIYEAVVDFSAHDASDVEEVISVLKGRFKRYIYISSDSVYEVCEFKLHEGFIKEEDAIRSHDPIIQQEYNSRNYYGHEKLEGEEILDRHYKKLNYDYIALRLPDVIGPRDNTERFWKYYMWTKLHAIVGAVHVKKELINKPLRFVYSIDAGNLITKLVLPGTYPESVWNQPYNLGFKETITLKNFILVLGSYINKGPIEFLEGESANLNYGYPSVTRGATDITKAEQMLNWKPTEIITALNETCKFYEVAQYNPKYKHLLDRVLYVMDVHGEKYSDFLDLHHDEFIKKEEL